MHSITYSLLVHRHFRASHILTAHKVFMNLHGSFVQIMRSICRMTSSMHKDIFSESDRLYGPELDPFASEPPESPPSAQQPPTRSRAEFQSAMSIVRDVIGEGRRLTIDLARSYERVQGWRERWGWPPLSPEAYDSPPPYLQPVGYLHNHS